MAAAAIWDAESTVAQLALFGTRPAFTLLVLTSAALWRRYARLLRELAWPRSILLLGGIEFRDLGDDRAANMCKLLNRGECKWQDLKPVQGIAHHWAFGAVAYDEFIYVVGGLQAVDPPHGQAESVFHPGLGSFNVNTGEWKPLPPIPALESKRHIPALLGDEIYVFCELGERMSRATFCYNIKSHQWSEKASMPDGGFDDQCCSTTAVATLNGSIYVCHSNLAVEVTRFMCFHPHTGEAGSWEVLQDLPTCRYYCFPLLAIDGELFAIGGHLESREIQQLGEIESYNPKTRRWTSRPPLPSGREGHCAIVVDEMLYVVGGTIADATRSADPVQDDARKASVIAAQVEKFVASVSSANGSTSLPWAACMLQNDPFTKDGVIWLEHFSAVATYADLDLPAYNVSPSQAFLHSAPNNEDDEDEEADEEASDNSIEFSDSLFG
ncbi:Kelch-like protein 28 [Symbiodinium microadriaticum]|uniref:Kelch-like protein 28 n=1 Tax=Symbiodinium microadriaticum TaxID=2951 RepID=A0A1Q9F1N2_SYMMI|nr:Kelch-like protein 28 [Symbiodinium microadriaticum]CAE7870763.1 Klhl28 [Symbiodinium microadriaticum]